MNVVWTRRALRRLEEIHDYIAEDSPARAARFCAGLVAAADRLRDHPRSGPLLPEDAAYRQLVVGGYRLVYRLRDDDAVVMTVVSPGMLLEQALGTSGRPQSR